MSARPAPRFEDGYFVPSAPQPDPRTLTQFKWYDTFFSIKAVVNNPLETFIEDHYKEDFIQYKLMGSGFTTINTPELIKYCFIENRTNYRFSTIRQNILRSILGDGILTSEGESWKHARRALSPMFTPRNVNSFCNSMRETTEREMPALFETDKVTLEIAPLMSALTYLVLSDTLFSGDIDSQRNGVIEDVSMALTYLGRPDPLDLLNAPTWVPRLTKLRGLNAVKRLRKAIADVTKLRQEKRESGAAVPDDFLTRLLNVGDVDTRAFNSTEIEDHLLAFIGAGHETTARALSWLFYLLSQDTDARDRLEAEVDALDIDTLSPQDWGEHLPFVTACFEETMRLFPPAPFVIRQAIAEDKFEDTVIPKGDVLFLNCWILHRHEKLWNAPNSFRPERFLGKARQSINRFQYLPFGVGERVCIGQRFALQEAVILIALIARRYRFDYASETPPWPKMRITIKPENEMPMRVSRRVP